MIFGRVQSVFLLLVESLPDFYFPIVTKEVLLRKVVEDRKLLKEEIDYAATPKISAMNFARSLTAPFSTFSI